jgi:hypothetical protein
MQHYLPSNRLWSDSTEPVDLARWRKSMRPNQSRGVAAYLLFTLALSSVFYFLIAKSGRVGGGWGAYIGCLMWCPGSRHC